MCRDPLWSGQCCKSAISTDHVSCWTDKVISNLHYEICIARKNLNLMWWAGEETKKIWVHQWLQWISVEASPIQASLLLTLLCWGVPLIYRVASVHPHGWECHLQGGVWGLSTWFCPSHGFCPSCRFCQDVSPCPGGGLELLLQIAKPLWLLLVFLKTPEDLEAIQPA